VGVFLQDGTSDVLDNVIARAANGVEVGSALKRPSTRILRNTFRDCETAVRLSTQATANLGNLGNTPTSDDGGNRFRSSTWFVRNQTPYRVPAEGNDWGTSIATEIEAKIEEQADNAAYGRVDFRPFVTSAAVARVATLALTGAEALPTAGGAEVALSLSAAGDVMSASPSPPSVATIARESP
jgi:hypothetical protein